MYSDIKDIPSVDSSTNSGWRRCDQDTIVLNGREFELKYFSQMYVDSGKIRIIKDAIFTLKNNYDIL